jgi:hypothetical protein
MSTPRFEVVRTPGFIAIHDTALKETILTVHTKVDATTSLGNRFLPQGRLNDRVTFILEALNAYNPSNPDPGPGPHS